MRTSEMRLNLRNMMFAVIGLLLLVAAGYGVWYDHRPLPEPVETQALFDGITYRREIRRQPRPMVVHVVTVDLGAPGIGFLVTPRDDIDGFIYKARTTSQFLTEFGLQLAINGDYFDPWHDYGPWDYYPHVGDGVNIRGFAASQGKVVSEGYAPATDYGTLFISADNRITFDDSGNAAYNAISGMRLLRDGQYAAAWGDAVYLEQAHPRTAVALDSTGRQVILVLVDGRQPNYSEGATMQELADLVLENGGYNALNLDGGGSTTLIIAGTDGQPVQLGSAIHARIPARERPVANHLGIFANPVR